VAGASAGFELRPAVLIAARVAPVTRHIGLVPVVVVAHTEPFHVSKAIATLDYVSSGRAGVQVRVSASPDEAAHFGRRAVPPLDLRDRADPAVQRLITGLFAEAADYVEVIRRLWDSWEDDAEIRDTATGRFVDRSKLHYIKFTGDYFSVKGPSQLQEATGADELIVTTITHDHADRVRSYQLLADEWQRR
jgi:alkanesulfonate monooxygenase SsuD/methylene tetrahydromethanopterin reductase-like flavin-dependent oxidoreductase (luciferase family)